MSSDPIDQLIADYCDGTITDQDLAVFCDWVRASPRHAGRVATFSVVNYGLVEVCKDDSSKDLMSLLAEIEARSPEVSPVDITEQLKQRQQQQSVKAKTRRPDPNSPRVFIIPRAVVWLGIAAVLGIVSVIAAQFYAKGPTAEDPPIARSTPAPSAGHTAATPAARFVDAHLAQWSITQQMDVGTDLFPGDTVSLESGFVELHTPTGTTVTIEGPCELVVLASNHLALNRGRLVAHTAGPEELFTVQTPHGEIVDLGTIFGVDVTNPAATSVAVFDGLVEVFQRVGPDSPPVSIRLEEGRMARIVPSNKTPITTAALDSHSKNLYAQSAAAARSSSFNYRRAVLANNPVAYWTFDEDVNRGVVNIADPGRFKLEAIGSPGYSEDGVAGAAARLDNRQPPYSYFETPNNTDLLGGYEDFTVEMWFKPQQQARSVLLDLYLASSAENPLHALVIELQSTVPSTTIAGDPGWVPGAVRGLHRNPPAYDVTGVNLYSQSGYRVQEWHHVVFLKRGSALVLYLDGQVHAQGRNTGKLDAGCLLTLGIAANIHHPGDNQTRHFSGVIDEVAIYGHAISDQEVAEHYRLVKPNE